MGSRIDRQMEATALLARNASTPIEALVEVDRSLAWSVPNWSSARLSLLELQHGHSGRPAGNGEPGGGTGASASTVVERCVSSLGGAGKAERRELERLERLPVDIEASVFVVVARLSSARSIPSAPLTSTSVRRLAWSRWAVRSIIGTYGERLLARPLPVNSVNLLHAQAAELDQLIRRHTDAPHRATPIEKSELASDPSEKWCRSHLRIGALRQRSDRYPTDGVCRWCGDFRGAQGFMPSPDLLEAHRDGKRITDAMLAAAKPGRKKRKRK
jgi:hypothetical protein